MFVQIQLVFADIETYSGEFAFRGDLAGVTLQVIHILQISFWTMPNSNKYATQLSISQNVASTCVKSEISQILQMNLQNLWNIKKPGPKLQILQILQIKL